MHQECTVIVFKESGDQDLAKLVKLFIVTVQVQRNCTTLSHVKLDLTTFRLCESMSTKQRLRLGMGYDKDGKLGHGVPLSNPVKLQP